MIKYLIRVYKLHTIINFVCNKNRETDMEDKDIMNTNEKALALHEEASWKVCKCKTNHWNG